MDEGIDGGAVAAMVHPIGPEMLEVLTGPEMEQHHDEKHLAKGELARSLALTA